MHKAQSPRPKAQCLRPNAQGPRPNACCPRPKAQCLRPKARLGYTPIVSDQPSAPVASPSNGRRTPKKKAAVPWLAIVCLIVSLFVFWGLPLIAKHTGPVQVDFEKPSK